jgi:hypothetical protein
LFLRVETQAQRIAVMIANDTLGLPGCENSEGTQFGDGTLGDALGALSRHVLKF